METTAYHQQCNGKAERFIRFLCKSLATMLNESHTIRNELIDCCVFIYLTSVSRVLNDSPFYMRSCLRDPVLPQDLLFSLKRKEKEEDGDTYKIEHLNKLRSAYEKLTATKQEYSQQYKNIYDQTHKHIEFNIDDYAMVYFPATQIGKTTKFLPKWQGPFKIIAKLSSVNYRVASVDGTKILVVHVQRLIPYKPWKMS